MRIVIVGAGAVGSYLAQRLSIEGQDIVVIESDPSRAQDLQDRIDCLVVQGNGASGHVLAKADVASASLLIAVTSSDAVNILACQEAERLGVPKRVARVEDPTLREDLDLHGVDVVIDPAEALSRELLLMVRRGGVSEVVQFADGRITLLGGRVQEDAPLDGITLRALRQRVSGWDWIVAAVVRDGETIVARGDSMIQADDHVLVVASGKSSAEALELMGVEEHRARKVVILGATRLAKLTAELLVTNGINTVLIDDDAGRVSDLATKYDRLVVVQGGTTDPRLLRTEGLDRADAVLGLTGWDDANILGCLVGKALGVPTAIARFHNLEYVNLLAGHGIDSGVSTRLAAASEILRFVRRGTIHSVATFQDTDAEAIELQVPPGSRVAGRTLQAIGLPRSAIVGGVVRGKKAFIPHGNTELEEGDRIIAIAVPEAIPSIEALFG
jgi:trk system potassium uptake protein TrkA